MSTTASRLISGSLASWALICVTIISQLALVPIYLSHWNVEEYGVWLAILAIINILSTVDVGHQTFLQYEFLKFGKERKEMLGKYLWAGIVISVFISLAQIVVIQIFLATDALPVLLGNLKTEDRELIRSAGIVLMLQSFTWLICTTIIGLISRALAPFGYWPRTAWWGFAYALGNALVPVTAVLLGADLLWTGIAYAAGLITYSIPCYIDLFRLLHKEKVFFKMPSLKLGYRNFVKSLAIFLRLLLENLRHQGARLLISPFAGTAGLAAFATMRTGANVALQGLNTIINPIMPDLMRFLHQRDRDKSEVAFATIWIVVVALIAPGIVLLQTFIEPFYVIWTHGKIPFNPLLFALLSMAVLIYASIQPAMAVIIGNNLIKPQLIITGTAAALVVGGIFVLLPRIDILGAGIALFLAELTAGVIYVICARRWLSKRTIDWPHKTFMIVLTSVFVAAAALSGLIWWPQFKWLIVVMSMALFIWNLWRFWKVLPHFASQRAREIIVKLPVIGKMLDFKQVL